MTSSNPPPSPPPGDGYPEGEGPQAESSAFEGRPRTDAEPALGGTLAGQLARAAGEQPGSLAEALPDLEFTLLELADRLLHRGVVLVGEATISVAGVDLVYLGLNVVLSSVENLRRPPDGGAAVPPRDR